MSEVYALIQEDSRWLGNFAFIYLCVICVYSFRLANHINHSVAALFPWNEKQQDAESLDPPGGILMLVCMLLPIPHLIPEIPLLKDVSAYDVLAYSLRYLASLTCVALSIGMLTLITRAVRKARLGAENLYVIDHLCKIYRPHQTRREKKLLAFFLLLVIVGSLLSAFYLFSPEHILHRFLSPELIYLLMEMS